jgi:transposase-like protein
MSRATEQAVAKPRSPIKPPERCPSCNSRSVAPKGSRAKKLETIRLYRCRSCRRTFTPGPRALRNKTYPLHEILDALSTYNRGYTLEETSRRLSSRHGHAVNPATISRWLAAHPRLTTSRRLRDRGLALFAPPQLTRTVKLYHRQVYEFSFHRAKLAFVRAGTLDDRRKGDTRFAPLADFLERAHRDCPHELFCREDGARGSQLAPGFLSLDRLEVVEKQNAATDTAALIIPAVGSNYERHSRLQPVDAFRIVETARGRSLADLLRRPRPQEGELSAGEKAARAEFNNLQRTLMGTSDRVQRGALLDKVFVAEQLMGAQAPPINAMQGATLQAHPVDLAKLRTVLLPGEVLLEYVLADPTSFCLVIDQKCTVIVSLPAGQKAIEEATDHYLNQVEAEKRDDTDAKELYDVLLGPVRQLPRTARLTIVPDGTLWRLPIETLRGPDGKYVLQSHTVSYAPSSTVLYYLRTLRRPLQPQMAFLGIGSVPYDLEPKDGGPSRGIMRAVSRGVYDVSGTISIAYRRRARR